MTRLHYGRVHWLFVMYWSLVVHWSLIYIGHTVKEKDRYHSYTSLGTALWISRGTNDMDGQNK